MKYVTLCLFLCLLNAGNAFAGGIYKQSITADYDTTYKKLYEALENSRFFVVNEINIGKSLSGFAEKWGAEYNQNSLDNIRVMIVCNGWYANQVSNKDPDMLALCPMSITLTSQKSSVTALFAMPSMFAKNSPALPILKEAEESVIAAIQSALK